MQYAKKSKAAIKAENTVTTLSALENPTVHQLKLLVNASLKLENRKASKVYKMLFEYPTAEIAEKVNLMCPKGIHPTFKTWVDNLPIGKDDDGNPAPKEYISIWDGLNSLAKLNPSAKAASKVAKQGGAIGKAAEKVAAATPKAKKGQADASKAQAA